MRASDLGREAGQHFSPSFLPDGKHFLFRTFHIGRTAIMAGVLGSMQTNPLLNEVRDTQYAPPGWLLFVSRGLSARSAVRCAPAGIERLAVDRSRNGR